jgi:hypothetical protein
VLYNASHVVEDLRELLHAEARRIIAGLVECIPAIEAPPDATGPPEAERPAVTRPWWRRIFGASLRPRSKSSSQSPSWLERKLSWVYLGMTG